MVYTLYHIYGDLGDGLFVLIVFTHIKFVSLGNIEGSMKFRLIFIM